MAGECMFFLTRKNVFLTRFHPQRVVLKALESRLSKEELDFIVLNWYTIDAIEVGNKITIYEIKTRNFESLRLGYKSKISVHAKEVYEKAIEMGFLVKVATVILNGDWFYTVNIDDYRWAIRNLLVDRPKKYDKSDVSYRR